MIRGVHIVRFRGIRECAADGFGRVNLIIGRNDCGKTAFMEALQIGDDADNAGLYLLNLQRARLGRNAKTHVFDRFWRPIFFDLDAKAGLSITITRDDRAVRSLEVRRAALDEAIVVSLPGRARTNDDYTDNDLVDPHPWALDLRFVSYNGVESRQQVVASSGRLRLPPGPIGYGSAWIHSGAALDEHDIRYVSEMKQRGQDETLVELLREVDGRVSGLEILAPGGDAAELFVRLDNGTPMLPVTVMGEGFQRSLDLGATAAGHDWPTIFIDEIENGMHHLVLEPLWRWIAITAARRNLQVFATTHSEECIQAASRAFRGLGDDGLRVIRLDRRERETRAVIYDRELVEAAERTGTEIRG